VGWLYCGDIGVLCCRGECCVCCGGMGGEVVEWGEVVVEVWCGMGMFFFVLL